MIVVAWDFAAPQVPYWFHNFLHGNWHWMTEGLLGLGAGVISGIYSGLVVTRMARFDSLKNELRRLILAIDFIGNESEVRLSVRKDVADLSAIASDFGQLGHREAADETLKLSSEIFSTVAARQEPADTIEQQYSNWQKCCRRLRPNLRVIYSPRPWP